MTHAGFVYRLPLSVHHTGGNDGSVLLPTPATADSERGPDYARANRGGSGGDDLVTFMQRLANDRLLPTPTVNDSRGGRNRTAVRTNPDSHQDGLTLTDWAWLLSPGDRTNRPSGNGKPSPAPPPTLWTTGDD